MLRVIVSTPEFDFEASCWHDRRRAELLVDGNRNVLLGPEAGWIDLEMKLVDLATEEALSFRSSPEAWAQALPGAYRAGDVHVSVEEHQWQAP